MLKRITLTNFQCHRKQRVEIDPLVTVIVGKSDSGKSAILRALRWVCQNTPSGDYFITHDENTAKVTLEFDDHKLIREKGKGVNRYKLDKQEYHALGQSGIPEAVSNALNVSDVNFQGQLEEAFWFNLSAGEVAREINQIVNLTLIDRSLDRVASDLRKAKAQEEVSQERLEKAQSKVDKLSWVVEANRELEELELKERTLAEIVTKRDLLRRIIDSIERLAEQQQTLSEAISDGEKLLLLVQECVQITERRDKLANLVKEIEKLCDEKTNLLNLITAKEEELNRKTGGLCPVCQNPFVLKQS